MGKPGKHAVVALMSGGKDSSFNMLECVDQGHEIVALANLAPADRTADEIESYMYQTIGHEVIENIARCMDVPLFRRSICGAAKRIDLNYARERGDEVEDMYELLLEVKRRMPHVTAVSCGAIASNYQRIRVENVCERLGLVSLCYLWQRPQDELLMQMIQRGLEAILIKVSSYGLHPRRFLGKTLAQVYPQLMRLNSEFGLNVCGEGGEYETLTLDCELFRERIVVGEFELAGENLDSDLKPVAVVHVKKMRLEPKKGAPSKPGSDDPLKSFMIVECDDEPTPRPSLAGEPPVQEEASDGPAAREEQKKAHDTDFQSLELTELGSEDQPIPSPVLLEKLFTRLTAELRERSLGYSDIAYVNLGLSSMDDFAACNEVYKKFIPQVSAPSRACVQLRLQDNAAESAAVRLHCVLSRRKRSTLHVQSISHWAPACIGPYSQATQMSEVLLLAGQIGLIPSTLALVPQPQQLRQSVLNTQRVLESLDSDWGQVLSNTVYLGEGHLDPEAMLSGVDRIHQELGKLLSSESLEQLRGFRTKSREAEGDEEKEAAAEDSESSSPILQPLYVVVPRLPKDAAVELQVSAVQSRMLRAPLYGEDFAEPVAPELQLGPEGGRFVKSRVCGLSKGFLGLEEFLTDFPALHSSVERRADLESKDRVFLRIFHKAEELPEERLRQKLDETLLKQAGDAVSFVPCRVFGETGLEKGIQEFTIAVQYLGIRASRAEQ